MNSLVSVVGARPQFIKAAAVSRALVEAGLKETIIHTGQHYDAELSEAFFSELGIPVPAVNLDVGSGSHAVQTGRIMTRLEAELTAIDSVECVLVYGDTNSTLAAAVTARKLHLPVAHVEAGLRSFNFHMPEEINRVVTDRLSDWLFCPTETSVAHLEREGIYSRVHLVGDVMYDAQKYFSARERRPDLNLPHAPYVVATVHRAENTDDPERLSSIVEGLGRLGMAVLLPAHPRARVRLAGRTLPPNIQVVTPLSYLEMLYVVQRAHCVVTDSGGLQKESIWFETPCITVREETEWPETLEGGWNVLAGADPDRLARAVRQTPKGPAPKPGRIGDGTASERIACELRSA